MRGRAGAVAALLLVALASVVSSAACGSSAPAKAAARSLTIKNFAFTPQSTQARAGEAIIVRNDDGTAHTLTADDKSAGVDSGRIDGGTSTTVTFARPGTYTYHCDIHNYMTGTIEAT